MAQEIRGQPRRDVEQRQRGRAQVELNGTSKEEKKKTAAAEALPIGQKKRGKYCLWPRDVGRIADKLEELHTSMLLNHLRDEEEQNQRHRASDRRVFIRVTRQVLGRIIEPAARFLASTAETLQP
mmetsp:Transcript_19365/g.42778  ORF Transcript_19365/g.42778 Transcript_19365/m.42778 type:complete len:125 (+) Transcript_19365:454-828(+)